MAFGSCANVNSETPAEVGPPAAVVLTADTKEVSLGRSVQILEDRSASLTFDDIRSGAYEASFVPSAARVPNLGYSTSAFWVRLLVDNRSVADEAWVLHVGFPNLNLVELFAALPEGPAYFVRRTGAILPAETRDLAFPGFAFLVPLPPGEEVTIYVRVETGSSVTLPLVLWRRAVFEDSTRRASLYAGVYYGAILVMSAFNLFLFFSLREKTYLFLALFLASTLAALVVYEGWADLLLPIGRPWLRQLSSALPFVAMGVTMIAFTDSFFGLGEKAPRLRLPMIVLSASWVVVGGLSMLLPWGQSAPLVLGMILLTAGAVVAVAVAMWRGGHAVARPYLLAWVGFALALGLGSLARFGLLRSDPIVEQAYRPGLLVLMALWSVALAGRITESRTESRRAGERLRLSEARLANLLEAVPVGVVVYDADGRLAYRNGRARAIMNDPARSASADGLGRTGATVARDNAFRVAGTDEPYPVSRMPSSLALRGEQVTRDDIEAEVGGRRVPIEAWATPVFDSDGRVQYAIVAFQDISRRREVEEELRHFRQQLESLVLSRTAALTASNARLNEEIGERRELEETIRLRAQWLSTYARISQSMFRAGDLPRILHRLAAEACWFLRAPSVAVFLRQGDSDEFVLAAGSIDGAETAWRPDPDVVTDSPVWRRFLEGEILAFDGRSEDTMLRRVFPLPVGQDATLAPILDEGRLAGALAIAPHPPAPEAAAVRAEVAREVASDVGQLLEKARLLDEAESILAEETRSGLARDLHDSVAQVLFSASLVADILPHVWRRSPEEGERGLLEVRRLNRAALAEMRSLLLELRPASILATPLSELMSQLVEATTSRSEMDFELYIEPIAPLPDDVHIAFYRIGQEAMNNVVKHSGADRVRLSLRCIPAWKSENAAPWNGTVRLEVADDGRGIAPGAKSTGPLSRGLAIMRERAEAIQADLQVATAPTRGTTIILTWAAGGSNHVE
jgi:two-component system nitrate/nitrite sensor histidine kinase NarX